MDVHPVALTLTLVLLVAGALVSAVVHPGPAQEEPTDAALGRRLGVVVLVRHLAGVVLAVVLAAFVLDPPARGVEQGPGTLGVVALLVSAVVVVQTTVVVDALRRLERD